MNIVLYLSGIQCIVFNDPVILGLFRDPRICDINMISYSSVFLNLCTATPWSQGEQCRLIRLW